GPQPISMILSLCGSKSRACTILLKTLVRAGDMIETFSKSAASAKAAAVAPYWFMTCVLLSTVFLSSALMADHSPRVPVLPAGRASRAVDQVRLKIFLNVWAYRGLSMVRTFAGGPQLIMASFSA